MKKRVVDMLVCPACLPSEHRLDLQETRGQKDEILEGSLNCSGCGAQFPITGGVAFLDPDWQGNGNLANKYELDEVVSSYLWSHFGDILGDEQASDAYQQWVDLVANHSGVAVDLGCAVGRFAFEMSANSDFTIGIDNSLAFIQTARELMAKGEMTFNLKEEGALSREVTIRLPKEWRMDRLEFIVADAQRLPFPSRSIGSIASLNLADKLPVPLLHIQEMNRVSRIKDSQFLLSDPFSWSEEAAAQEDWLGGTETGEFAGYGLENIIDLLKGDRSGLQPCWQVDGSGYIWWKIRTHRNHYELIKSCYVKASR